MTLQLDFFKECIPSRLIWFVWEDCMTKPLLKYVWLSLPKDWGAIVQWGLKVFQNQHEIFNRSHDDFIFMWPISIGANLYVLKLEMRFSEQFCWQCNDPYRDLPSFCIYLKNNIFCNCSFWLVSSYHTTFLRFQCEFCIWCFQLIWYFVDVFT